MLENAKKYWKEHKEEIKKEAMKVGYYTFGFGIGCLVGQKMYKNKVSSGIAYLMGSGDSLITKGKDGTTWAMTVTKVAENISES